MGGSRRRAKKNRPKVRIAVVKQSKKYKSPVPTILASNCPAVEDKLGRQCQWETEATPSSNYEKNGFVKDPSLMEGCAGRFEGDLPQAVEDLDVDLRTSVLSKPHPDGPRAPAPLTATQFRVIKSLIEAHGENVKAMVTDSKRNKMLHSEGTLRRMLAAYHMHGHGGKVHFQQPKKFAKIR